MERMPNFHADEHLGVAAEAEGPNFFPPENIDESDSAYVREEIYRDDGIFDPAPQERFKLGYLDVICLVVNRMIGTGIFMTPGSMLFKTKSVGVSMIFWAFGVFFALAGAHVYVEYGLNVPRYIIKGREQSVPRSGGDLHYLQYVYSWPRYRRNTVLYMGVLFGISFICLGNVAGNCVVFADRVLYASNSNSNPSHESLEENDRWMVTVIAVAVATVACLIHTLSRRGGILLSNLFALIKIGILLLIVVTAIVVSTGAFKYTDPITKADMQVPNEFSSNMGPKTSFAHRGEANDYAYAFLGIIFAFAGFDQPNYVLGEIERPRRKFPIAMFASVFGVGLLYMMVNISYMVVVPQVFDPDEPGFISEQQNIADLFFTQTFGQIKPVAAWRMYNAFLAISSCGNIIVMTYTAARMKQEIAKEGFIPNASFFARGRDWSFGRLLSWLESQEKMRWLTTRVPSTDHCEITPVGALLLHLLSCFVLILGTQSLSPGNAYKLLSFSYTYAIQATFGCFLALGILILRFRGSPDLQEGQSSDDLDMDANNGQANSCKRRPWRDMSAGTVNPTTSVISALIYLLGNAWPMVVSWVPPIATPPGLEWWVMPSLAVCVLATSTLWFLGFVGRAKHLEHRRGLVFVAERRHAFQAEDFGDDDSEVAAGTVLLHETVYLSWKDKNHNEMMQSGGREDDAVSLRWRGGSQEEGLRAHDGNRPLANQNCDYLFRPSDT